MTKTEPGSTVPMLLRTARRTYAALVRSELIAAGFDDVPNNGQYVIRAVSYGSTLSEIARDLSVSKQAASQLIEILVVRQYLERKHDALDRRRINLTLSSRGKRAARIIEDGTAHVNEVLAKSLSARQLAGFHAGLELLADMFAGLESFTEQTA